MPEYVCSPKDHTNNIVLMNIVYTVTDNRAQRDTIRNT